MIPINLKVYAWKDVLKNKRELVRKFILAVLKQEMDSEYIRYYDNMHLNIIYDIMYHVSLPS